MDLIFDTLNDVFFDNQVQIKNIIWKKNLRIKGRGKGDLIGFNDLKGTIYISTVLRSPDLPDGLLEYMVFHEMLHLVCPARPNVSLLSLTQEDSHHEEFLAAEKLFPQYDYLWEKYQDLLEDRLGYGQTPKKLEFDGGSLRRLIAQFDGDVVFREGLETYKYKGYLYQISQEFADEAADIFLPANGDYLYIAEVQSSTMRELHRKVKKRINRQREEGGKYTPSFYGLFYPSAQKARQRNPSPDGFYPFGFVRSVTRLL